MRIVLSLFLCLAAQPAAADAYVAAKTLAKGVVLGADDLILSETDGKAPVTALADFVGLETRRVIYKGAALRRADLGPATVVKRNDLVVMNLNWRGMAITAKGRALDPGGIGETVRIMNLDSRKIVNAQITGAGAVEVRQ